VELLCAGLSGGAVGMEAGSGCQLFMAIDPNRFGISDLPERVAGYASLMAAVPPRRAPNGEWQAPPELVAKLNECAAKVGVERTLE
jgi:hypothetical protein